MPSNDDLDRLASLSKIVEGHEDWRRYARYLELRSQGRRSESLRALDEFLSISQHWSFDDRLSFLRWIGMENALRPFDNLLVPQPLLLRLLSPTSSEWLKREPVSAFANFLYGIFVAPMDENSCPLDYLRRAVELDPTDQAARTTFINWVAGHAENAQHELPWYGYLGSAADDIEDLRDALRMVAGINHPSSRYEFTVELTDFLETAEAWETFRKTGEADFVSWCVGRGAPARILKRL
jgi:hypothetical protein